MDPSTNAIEVTFTNREKTLIVENTFYDPDFGERLNKVPGEQLFVGELTLDELEDMTGFIAASANHTDDETLEVELDALYDRLFDIVESIDPGRL